MNTTIVQATRIAIVSVAIILAGAAWAQDPPRPDPLAQHLRLEARIRDAADLTEPQRSQMQVNLEACRALGLGPDEIAPFFPAGADDGLAPATALRLQSELIRAARGELPLEPLLAKIREGRMKQAPDEALVRAAGTVTDDMIAADALLASAAADGLAPPADGAERRAQVRILSRAMWRGLTPEQGARLQVHARERLQHGPCATADLAAAAETAVRIREQGGDPDEALQLAGKALVHGYTADDLAELGRAVTSGRLAGGDIGSMLGVLSAQIEAGLEAGSLNRALEQSGWMGPADAPGAGGRSDDSHQGDGPGSGSGGGAPGGSGSGAGSSGAGTGEKR